MSTIQYFRDGRLISAAEALDAAGCLRDGITQRTRMMMRDARRKLVTRRDPRGS